jgi:hypothetical protein
MKVVKHRLFRIIDTKVTYYRGKRDLLVLAAEKSMQVIKRRLFRIIDAKVTYYRGKRDLLALAVEH